MDNLKRNPPILDNIRAIPSTELPRKIRRLHFQLRTPPYYKPPSIPTYHYSFVGILQL